MPALRNIGATAFALVWIFVVVSRRSRRPDRTRIASHRVVDRDARAALEAWDDEGGAIRESQR